MKEQIDQLIEERDGKVFVTVGSGGFPIGTADLTAEAQRIIDRIALTAMSPDSSIWLQAIRMMCLFNDQFRDNWDLAAGRAASVVQALENTTFL